MLEIKLSVDKQQLALYCPKCAVAPSAAHYLYLATDRDKTLAAALFEVQSDSVQVLLYDSSQHHDPFLLDGVLRAGLNYAATQGIATGMIAESVRHSHRQLFDQLNFPSSPSFNITNFFRKYKTCTPLPPR